MYICGRLAVVKLEGEQPNTIVKKVLHINSSPKVIVFSPLLQDGPRDWSK